MSKYLFLIVPLFLVLSCTETEDPPEDLSETVTFIHEFSGDDQTTGDEHEIEYEVAAGNLKLTVVGSGGGGGGGSTPQGIRAVGRYASGGGGGAGEVIELDNIDVGTNPRLKIIFGAVGKGGAVENAGSNAGITQVILMSDSTNPIAIALGGKGGKAGNIFEAGDGGTGYPDGNAGRGGSAGEGSRLPGGSGGDNGSEHGAGGDGGQGEATNNGEATAGDDGRPCYIKITMTGLQ